MNKTLRTALIAFVIAGAISFVVSFAMTAMGSDKGPQIGQLMTLPIGAIIALIFFIRWSLSGNRRTVVADADMRGRALAFAPAEGRAAIYLIRTGFVAKAAGMNITVDGREVVQLKSPQFTCIDVAPGAHDVGAALAGGAGAQSHAQATQVMLQAGEAAALLMTIKMGGMKNNIEIESVPVERAKGLVAGIKMIAPA